jgi:hypothetical protein
MWVKFTKRTKTAATNAAKRLGWRLINSWQTSTGSFVYEFIQVKGSVPATVLRSVMAELGAFDSSLD